MLGRRKRELGGGQAWLGWWMTLAMSSTAAGLVAQHARLHGLHPHVPRSDEIDFTGDTWWYSEYFYAFPTLSNRTCNTDIVLTTAPGAPKASQRSILTCRPNPTSEGVCTLSPRLETASSATVTQESGYSDQFKAGIVTKIKASFGSMETTMESTFDFAFR